MFAIARKTLFEKRWSLVAWTLGAMAMVWLTMILYPSFSQSDQIDQFLKSLPSQMQGLMGNVTDFRRLGGYIDGVVFSTRMPMITVPMAIIFGIGSTAADEERGTMSTLLAQPVTRSRVLWEKFAALAVSIFIVHIGILIGLLLALLTIGYSYSFGLLAAVTFGCFLLTMVFGALTFGMGAALGSKGVVAAVASAAALLSLLVQTLAPSVKSLQHIQKFSPFYYYSTPNIASNGLDWSYVALQIIGVAVFALVGWGIFRHRDIEV